MRYRLLCAFIFAALVPRAALAIVGSSEAGGAAARHTVMVLKRQASGAAFCSGAVLGRHVILTAAHCVAGGKGIAIYLPVAGAPVLYNATSVVMHPGYVANAIAKRKRSIDLALVRTRDALPTFLIPVQLDRETAIAAGARLTIAGFGLRQEGVERSAGTLRLANLVVRAPLSSILIWMRSSARSQTGACTGDSGGPVFTSDITSLVGITVWSGGRGKKRCGDLTQAIRIAPHRTWIASVMAQWGAR